MKTGNKTRAALLIINLFFLGCPLVYLLLYLGIKFDFLRQPVYFSLTSSLVILASTSFLYFIEKNWEYTEFRGTLSRVAAAFFCSAQYIICILFVIAILCRIKLLEPIWMALIYTHAISQSGFVILLSSWCFLVSLKSSRHRKKNIFVAAAIVAMAYFFPPLIWLIQ